MVDSKRFCNLSYQLLDLGANYSKNEITPCHKEWFQANSFIVFRFSFDYTVRMKNRDFAAMSMSYNFTSLMDMFFEFKDGMILIN